MAGRNKEPINLVLAKGKKHLTKAEIKQRLSEELDVPSDAIAAPSYLTKAQANDFNEIAQTLIELEIMTNLDCDALASYIVARDGWVNAGKQLRKKDVKASVELTSKWTLIESRYRKDMRTAAVDLGLTITSRGKIVAPVKEQSAPPTNKFAKFSGGGSA